MIVRVEEQGVLTRCRKKECLALNPNPRKNVCWKCGETLTCPKHTEVLLDYIVDGDYWRCSLASHSQKYQIIPPEREMSLAEREALLVDINTKLAIERKRRQQLEEEHRQEVERERRQQAVDERRQEEERKKHEEWEKRMEAEVEEKAKEIRAADRRQKGLCETCGIPLGFLNKKLVGQTQCKKCRGSIDKR